MEMKPLILQYLSTSSFDMPPDPREPVLIAQLLPP